MNDTLGPRSVRFAVNDARSTVPVEVWENLTLVHCRVNESAPAWFVFDTGAGITALDTAFARQIDLDLSETPAPGQAGLAGPRVHGLTLSMPGVELTDLAATVADLTELALFAGHPLAGVFGYELLRQAIVEIDYAGQTLAVAAPLAPAAPDHGERLPLAIVGRWPVIAVRLEQAGLPPVDNRVIADSGSLVPISLMTSSLARETIELPASAGVTGVGAGSNRAGRLAALTIGPWTLDQPPAVFPPASATESADYLAAAVASTGIGLIGAPVLSRFRLTFDYPHAALWLAPSPNWDAPLEWDRSGAVVMAADMTFRSFVVLGVSAGSPAAEAGLVPGDRIVAVDGEPAGHFTLPQLRELLKLDGVTVVLTLRRGPETMDLPLALRTLI